MEIFANHAHVFPDEVRPEGSIESLLRLMDTCGIARAVCFAPFRRQVADAGCREPNEWLVEAIADQPRLVGFACIDPVADDALDRLARAREMGLVGCKLHPAFDRFDILDQRAVDFYAAAQEIGMVLDFHTGPHWWRISDYHPLKFDEIAFARPGLCMILEHMGGRPFFEDVLAVLGNNLPINAPGNLYGGISSVLNRDYQKLWYLGIERVAEAIHILGEDMPIFGLDFPYNTVEHIRDDITQLSGLGLSREGMAKLFGGNLQRAIAGPSMTERFAAPGE
ncbi:MAG TPA: amidohydrolase family protein [Armatimonadota bacterium]|nr:amidohydrolase family protein [Armatimonadota bacterium]